MEELTREEFLKQKADAAQRIKELYRGHTMPPYPDFVSLPGGHPKAAHEARHDPKPPSESELPKPAAPPAKRAGPTHGFIPSDLFRFLNLPELLKSPDALLILGLIFLLMSDNADEKLILALVFIML